MASIPRRRARLAALSALAFALATAGCGDAGDGGRGVAWVDPATVLPARPTVQRCFSDFDRSAPPTTLRATGCFDGDGAPVATAELVPYAVNAALWTDGAEKYRYMVLPPGERVEVPGDAPWEFPVGSVLVKTFAFALADGSGGVAERPVETRFMVRDGGGWAFLTYAWADDGRDGVLLTERRRVTLEVGSERVPVAYTFPDEEQCRFCHAETAEMVLGPRSPQLDRRIAVPGGETDQLAVFAAVGLFGGGEIPRAARPWVDPYDDGADVEARARSWLAANCAHCHQPGGWQPPPMTMDLRFDRTLAETNTCGVPLQYTDLLVGGPYRIAPGAPGKSNLLLRAVHDGLGRMPPVAVSVPDARGMALLERWIAGMDGCPPR